MVNNPTNTGGGIVIPPPTVQDTGPGTKPPPTSPFTTDTYAKADQLTRAFLDNLTSNNPQLYLFTTSDEAGAVGVNTGKITGNVWLLPTPLTAFVEAFNNMATNEQKSSLLQSALYASAFKIIGDLLQDDKEQIKISTDAEVTMDDAAIASGVITAVGSGLSVAASFRGIGPLSKFKPIANMGEGEFSAFSQGIQQGFGAAGTIEENITKAQQTVVKGGADGLKVLIDGQMQMMHKLQDSQIDAKKTMEDIISQLMQTLPQLVKDLLTKHVLSLHG